MPKTVDNIIIENARIIFRNFSGEATQYNRAGKRKFNVIIEDPDLARDLIADGWNIKARAPRDEGDDPTHYIEVEVSFKNIPPKVIAVTRKAKRVLNEDTISELDYADIKHVDLTIRPYCWEVNGATGVKAYLKTMYAVIEEDDFADKYEDIPF